MPSSRADAAAYELAFLALPYAVPATVGFVLLLWGSLELVPIVTTFYGDVVDLFETLVVVTVGVTSLLYGAVGAFVVALRTPGPARPGDEPR